MSGEALLRFAEDGAPADLLTEMVVEFAENADDTLPENAECIARVWGLRRDQPFLLVQRCPASGRVWLSTHAGPGEAGAYQDREPTNDWVAERLVDVRTGDRYAATTMTAFRQTHCAGKPIEH